LVKIAWRSYFGIRTHTIFGYRKASTGQGRNEGQSATVKYSADDVQFIIAKDKKAMYRRTHSW